LVSRSVTILHAGNQWIQKNLKSRSSLFRGKPWSGRLNR
jgi:hypothetical protein